MAAKLVKCTGSFAIPRPGVEVLDTLRGRLIVRNFVGGVMYVIDDAVLKKLPPLFVDAEEIVEQATSAPGEKRTATTRKKKTTKKEDA